MLNLTTESELADLLGKTVEQVGALRRKHCWPHVYLGRYDRRYTDDQLAGIVAQMTRQSHRKAPDEPAVDMGQTTRSARRRAG